MDQRRTRVAVVGTGAWWGREHAIIRSFETGTRVATAPDPA